MNEVYVVEVEGADYDGRCYVLTAMSVEGAVEALKKKYERFNEKQENVHWHELQSVSQSDSKETFWSIDADFELVPAYFNKHTAHYYITPQQVHA